MSLLEHQSLICGLLQIDQLLSLLVDEMTQSEKTGQPPPLTIVFVERKVR